jgi:ABC-type multidrug transport system ATPase subunit
MSSYSPARSSAEPALLRFHDVEKRYGRSRVLQIPSLELFDGDTVNVGGANGSGKSTFLRLAAGVSPASRGRVWRAPDLRRLRIAYVPQFGGLYPSLTVEENLRLWLGLYERTWTVSPSARSASERFALDAFMGRNVGSLSGGYQKLAALACALSVDPDCLFLDEPFSGLDEERSGCVGAALTEVSAKIRLLVVADHEPRPEFVPKRLLTFESGVLRP